VDHFLSKLRMHNGAVMLRFPNTLGVIFGAGMTQIAWRAGLVGSARCADRTPQRGVPTVEILRFAQNDMTSESVRKFGGRGMKSDYRAFGIWKT